MIRINNNNKKKNEDIAHAQSVSFSPAQFDFY